MGQLAAIPPDVLARTHRALAAALWHYTTTPVAKPYYVRGSIPDLNEPRVTVGLWTGPAAREKRNLFLSLPLVSGGVPVSATQVTLGLLGLGRGTHMFGFTGRWFDGKRILNGSTLLEGVAASWPPVEGDEQHGPRGFYFERPGQLTQY
ncbi:hypothetical protein [Streptomyces sp. NPDC046862]|uniref:hypothetical protein n=1 Tax=Streptomyces sp. NPDC046862 TaxID=3154603 RepID=UPI003456B2A2